MPFILIRAALLALRVGLTLGSGKNVLTVGLTDSDTQTCLLSDLTGEARTCLPCDFTGDAVFTGEDGFSADCCSLS